MSEQNELFPKLSRREFHKLAVGAGAALAVGSVLPGCGSSDSPPPSGPTTETQTIHFTIHPAAAEGEHTLHSVKGRFPVQKHTAETLAASGFASAAPPPTHYAIDARFSAERPHTYKVTTRHPVRGDGLLLTALHIPGTARAKAARKSSMAVAKSSVFKAVSSSTSDPSSCTMQDQITDSFITTFDAAKSLVFHHPEITSLDADTAAAVEKLIGQSAEVINLASKICDLGPAYQHDPTGYYKDGWCVLVPYLDDNGNPRTDSSGNQLYDYQFNPLLSDSISAAVKEILTLNKNDSSLNGTMYTSHPVGSSSDTSLAAKASERYRLWKSGGVQLTATNTGYKHNVLFKSPSVVATSPQQFSIVLDNWNFIWYGLYVQYLDAAGKPISSSDMGSMLTNLSKADDIDGVQEVVTFLKKLEVETDTFKWEGVISSPSTLFGVPLPQLQASTFTLPDGAVSARVMLCGPGAFGKVDAHGGILLPGILLTAIINMALPTYFLWSGSGIDKTTTLWTLLKKPGVMFALISFLFKGVKEILDPDYVNGINLLGSIESFLAKLAPLVIQLFASGQVPGMKTWFVEEEAEEEAEESIPFAGWVVRILTIIGTVADINATIMEICLNPVVIDNTITFTNSVDVTINHDPTDGGGFPEKATYYEIRFGITNSAFPATAPLGYTLDQAARGSWSFPVTVDNVPTSGLDTDTVEVWFYDNANKGFLAGHGKSTFSNKATSTGANITASVTITENPMSITASTVYQQHRKLAYSNGAYIWQESGLTDPVPTIFNCSSGICNLTNISVWVPGGMIGYSWQSGNSYQIKNINASEKSPAPGMKSLNPSGIGAPTPVYYDREADNTQVNGNHFYLDPVSISADNPDYELRKLDLDSTSSTFKTSDSWGRFRIPLDRIAVHPHGYVIGISTIYSKMAVLEIPATAYADDTHGNNAAQKLGEGIGDKLIKSPVALTISRTGAILILQGSGAAMSVRAFDTSGNPWPYFGTTGNLSSTLNLTSVDPNAVWLDISIDDTELIFILSYTGSGASASQYALDVYKKDGTRVVRTTGIAVYRMMVDKFRKLYTLNSELISGSGVVEPSVSVWLPN